MRRATITLCSHSCGKSVLSAHTVAASLAAMQQTSIYRDARARSRRRSCRLRSDAVAATAAVTSANFLWRPTRRASLPGRRRRCCASGRDPTASRAPRSRATPCERSATPPRATAAAPSARPSIPGLTLTSPRATQPRARRGTDHHRREKTDTTALERLAFEMAAQAQSDPRVVVSPRFMSVMRRADDGADARVEARDPMGAPRGVSLMFNERRTLAAERQREWRMDPRAFSD